MMRIGHPCAAILGLALVVASVAFAADVPVERIYDVRALLVEIPQFDTPFGSEDCKPATRPAATREQLVAELIRTIRQARPDAWRGPQAGTIREHDGHLVVTAPADTHAHVQEIVGQLHRTRSLQVSVEARFISVSPRLLQQLGLAGPSTRSATAPAAVQVDAEQARKLLLASQNQQDAAVVSAPTMTMFNGQRAYVLVGTDTAYVKDFTAVRDEKGNVRFEPEPEVVMSGTAMQVQASISDDRKYVTLQVHARLTALRGMRREAYANSPPGQDLKIQVPDLAVRELKTAVSIPDGGTMLLGLTGGLEPEATTRVPSTRPADDLPAYLLVKPTIIAD